MTTKKTERKAQVQTLNAAAMAGTIPDALNELFIFSQTHNELLVAIATRKIDAVQLAREELANRGIGKAGTWVGFERAEIEWGL